MSVAFPTRRAGAVAALLVVGALDLHTTAVGLRAHARLRERSLSGLRQATVPTVSPPTPARTAPPVAGGVEAELVGLLASMALAVATGR